MPNPGANASEDVGSKPILGAVAVFDEPADVELAVD